MAHASGPMKVVLDGAAQLNAWAGELTGLAFADERGWLSDDERARFRDMDSQFPIVQAELAARWRELPADVVGDHDARVRRVLDQLRDAGGVLEHFYLADLGPRATATCSPGREFDYWAIWAIHQIGQPK
jgi:hypothetical protein